MPPPATFTIHPARSPADIATARHLFQAYAAAIDTDLSYQNFPNELVTLPGAYAPPSGELLLATNTQNHPLGCVALRPLPGAACEMKRLFVAQAARGQGLGRALIKAVIAAAESIGYLEMRLDTLPTMHAASRLYTEARFIQIPAYYKTPVSGTIFLALPLRPKDAPPGEARKSPP